MRSPSFSRIKRVAPRLAHKCARSAARRAGGQHGAVAPTHRLRTLRRPRAPTATPRCLKRWTTTTTRPRAPAPANDDFTPDEDDPTQQTRVLTPHGPLAPHHRPRTVVRGARLRAGDPSLRRRRHGRARERRAPSSMYTGPGCRRAKSCATARRSPAALEPQPRPSPPSGAVGPMRGARTSGPR